MAIKATPVSDRLWAMVTKSESCWLWQGFVRKDGYASVFDGDRYDYIHRVAYRLLVGPIPEGLHIDHLCRIRNCVNPDHLEPVTPGENVRRGLSGINNYSKTHCKSGHEFTPENTYHAKGDGSRHCRTCKSRWDAQYYLRKKEKTTNGNKD